MRLLRTSTLKFEEFLGETIPPYAILSHTWGSEEVSYSEMVNGRDSVKLRNRKIIMCCEQAKQEGLEYAWIDTCCIDKSSSAELSEAINSMFQWYQASQICYAYLEDVIINTKEPINDQLRRSRWFTRGWTLQELIAPKNLVFCSQDMTKLGTKVELASLISSITGIDTGLLQGQTDNLQSFSIAQRMSWAAKRQTTRLEDRAYSLLGLFDVNMPLIYGEGLKAFRRLQKKILKQSEDRSIFAWSTALEKDTSRKYGLLAPSLDDFRECNDVRDIGTTEAFDYFSTPIHVSPRGLGLSMPLRPVEPMVFIAFLNCYRAESSRRICIWLEPQISKPNTNLFHRVRANSLVHITAQESETRFLHQRHIVVLDPVTSRIHEVPRIRFLHPLGPPGFAIRFPKLFPEESGLDKIGLCFNGSLYSEVLKFGGSPENGWTTQRDGRTIVTSYYSNTSQSDEVKLVPLSLDALQTNDPVCVITLWRKQRVLASIIVTFHGNGPTVASNIYIKENVSQLNHENLGLKHFIDMLTPGKRTDRLRSWAKDSHRFVVNGSRTSFCLDIFATDAYTCMDPNVVNHDEYGVCGYYKIGIESSQSP